MGHDNPPKVNRTFFRKSLIIVSMITCIPTALLGLFFYYFGSSQIEHEVEHAHQKQLKLALQRIDDNFSTLEMSAAHWGFNELFQQNLQAINLQDQFSYTQSLYQTISLLKGSSPLIDQIYLYIAGKSVLISDNTGVNPIRTASDREIYQNLLSGKRTMFWTDALSKLQARDSSWAPYSFVIKLPPTGKQADGALVVYLNKNKLDTLINGLTIQIEGSSLLSDGNGHLISSTSGASPLDDSFINELQTVIHKDPSSTGSQLLNWRKKNYSVSFGTLQRLGTHWVYINVVQVSQLTAPVRLMAKLLVGFSLSALLLAIGLSWLASKQLYRPLRRLLDVLHVDKEISDMQPQDEFTLIEKKWNSLSRESQILQSKVDQQLPSLREGYLLQLTQGFLTQYREHELVERMEQLGWEPRGKIHSISIIQLSGFANLHGKFSRGDEQLVTFAAANIVQEYLSQAWAESDIMNFQDLTVGLWLRFESSQPKSKIKAEVFHHCQHIIETLNHLLKLQVTISMGRLTESLHNIPEVVEETRKSLKHRDLKEAHQILDMDELLARDEQVDFYPYGLEKEIIYALRIGEEEEVNRLIRAFMEQLETKSGIEWSIHQSMLQLLGNIQYTLMQSGFNLYSMYEGRNLYEELLQLHEPEQIHIWFEEIIGIYMRNMETTQNLKLKQLIEKMIVLLNERYMEDLSLEAIADLFGTYPQKLSMDFKKITGKSFVDYLTEIRIDKSKDLLLSTDFMINEIATKVGYQPSYFTRLFKRYTGLTPGQFRNSIE